MPLSSTSLGSIPQPPFNDSSLETSLGPTEPSDEALVRSARTGDASAFGELIERHYRSCLSNAYAVLRDWSDAEDEVQNACTKAWTHLWQFQGEGSFGGWLSRIVSNQCLMKIRERKYARMVSVDEVVDSELSFKLEAIDQRALPEELVGGDEVSRVLLKEIHGVPPLLRQALVMRELRQQAMQDIASDLGISTAAAKSRLMRGRLELKRRLMKHCGDKGVGTLFQKSGCRKAVYTRVN